MSTLPRPITLFCAGAAAVVAAALGVSLARRPRPEKARNEQGTNHDVRDDGRRGRRRVPGGEVHPARGKASDLNDADQDAPPEMTVPEPSETTGARAAATDSGEPPAAGQGAGCPKVVPPEAPGSAAAVEPPGVKTAIETDSAADPAA